MDTRIAEWVDQAKVKFGLSAYVLNSCKIHRRVELVNQTVYYLTMEWWPSAVAEPQEEGYNPEGTAVIKLDLNRLKWASVIFVGGQSYADTITFERTDLDRIIPWIEQETGLTYGKQFKLMNQKEDGFTFQECLDGIPVSPTGLIEVKFDLEGKLTFYSAQGSMLARDKVEAKAEDYSLSLDQVEGIAKQQFKLVEFPAIEKNQYIPVYGIEEIYVTNDLTGTIPFEFIVDNRARKKMDKVLRWTTALGSPFLGVPLNLVEEEVTPEQAFSLEPHPDTYPITAIEQERCIDAVRDFLRQVYPDDSEKWVLHMLYRDHGYIDAKLMLNNPGGDQGLHQGKMLVILDRDKFNVLNYMDNRSFLSDVYQELQAAAPTTVNRDDAFEKIKPLIELKSVYVYDFEQEKYILCEKIDCQYGVHAATGEIVSLNDL
ncbi:hypothetical protein ACFQ3W_02470 [Paenibacillus puldeungensis]|uniref:DUF4901 domain-containing protein n=1 Tax=Paenibacillus puldeungensis TaxID=696536 RepID=A0ABW3RRV1_9BACL